MSDITLAHESYFSRSLPGSKLNRHLDERHEETKGKKKEMEKYHLNLLIIINYFIIIIIYFFSY